MNPTFHIIRKDLHTLRWGLLLWVLACLNHLVLRLVQLSRGDEHPFDGRMLGANLETPFRWDYLLLVALSVLLVPAVLLADPLTRPLAFWKALPIRRTRLISAKLILIAALFVLLPLACETFYFLKAGLGSVLAESLGLWSLRFLPGIAVLVLAGMLAPGLKSALPVIAAGMGLVVVVFHYPVGRVSGIPDRTPSSVIAPPAGAGVRVDSDSATFMTSYREEPYEPGKPKKRIESLGVSLSLDVTGLGDEVKVDQVSASYRTLRVGDKTLAFPSQAAHWNGGLPVAEESGQFNRNSGFDAFGREHWGKLSSPMIDFSAADIPPEGAMLEGEAEVRLVRRKTVATLPVETGAAWQAGLHRLSLVQASPPESAKLGFEAALKIVTSDPDRRSSGLDLTRNDRHHLWLEHRSLPLRSHVLALGRPIWSHGMPGGQDFGAMDSFGSRYDPTRCLRLGHLRFSLDPAEIMIRQVGPLAATRFAEEQAQTRNWQLKVVTYEPAGSIRVPIQVRVPKPGHYLSPRRRDAAGMPLPPPLAEQLAGLPNAAGLPRPEARRVFDRLERIAGNLNDDQIGNHETEIHDAISAFGREHLEMLLERSFEALRPVRTEEYQEPY